MKISRFKHWREPVIRRDWRAEWFLSAVSKCGYYPGNLAHAVHALKIMRGMRSIGMMPRLTVELKIIPHTGRKP